MIIDTNYNYCFLPSKHLINKKYCRLSCNNYGHRYHTQERLSTLPLVYLYVQHRIGVLERDLSSLWWVCVSQVPFWVPLPVCCARAASVDQYHVRTNIKRIDTHIVTSLFCHAYNCCVYVSLITSS